MPNFDKFHRSFCKWSPATLGYVIGWLGVIFRTAAVVTFSVLIVKNTDDDSVGTNLTKGLRIPDGEQRILAIVLGVALIYSLFSVGANLLLIVGISKKNPYFILPYLTVEVIEFCAGCTVIIGGPIYFPEIRNFPTVAYFVPLVVILLGAYVYSWHYMLKLFNNFKAAAAMAAAVNGPPMKNALNLFKRNLRSAPTSREIPL